MLEQSEELVVLRENKTEHLSLIGTLQEFKTAASKEILKKNSLLTSAESEK